MTFLKFSAIALAFATLGMACGDDGGGESRPDAYVIPRTGGAPGAGGTGAGGAIGTGGATGAGGAIAGDAGTGGTTGVDSGAGGSTVVVDGGSPDVSLVDSGAKPEAGGGEAGGTPAKEIHIQIINAATSGGLDVTGPTPVPYTSCM